MKHYFYPGRSITTDWMLKELDAPHEQIVVDFPGGENDSPEFRAINPMGKVPALVDGDTVVTETAAICAHPATRSSRNSRSPLSGSRTPIPDLSTALSHSCTSSNTSPTV